MFGDIYYSQTRVKICTNITYSFLSLTYEIEDKDENRIEDYLSKFLPFCNYGLVKVKNEKSNAIRWSKQILEALGYEEQEPNIFVLKSEPKAITFAHAIMYVPTNYNEIGKSKNILFNTFGNQLAFWSFLPLMFPFNVQTNNKGGYIKFGDSTKLNYDIVNVIESLLDQLDRHTIDIEKGLEIQTSMYGRTEYNAYQLQDTHLINLNKYEGKVIPPRIIYTINDYSNSISLKYCHNVSQKFIDELNSEVDKNKSRCQKQSAS